MATATEKRQDREDALAVLEKYRQEVESGNALFLIHAEYGKGETDFFRVQIIYTDNGKNHLSHLTWHIGKAFGYSLRERTGTRWYLAIRGGNFSKSDEIARTLANFYGVERVRYENA